MRLKNLLIDMFKQTEYEEANISELKRVLVFSSVSENVIQARHYEVNSSKPVNEIDVT